MLAKNASRFGLVIVAVLAITACARTKGMSVGAKDSGTTLPDLVPQRDLPADDSAVHADAAADVGVVADDTGPDTPGLAGSGNGSAGWEVDRIFVVGLWRAGPLGISAPQNGACTD